MDSISKTSSLLSAFQSAQLGIDRGLAGLERDAQTIAHANVEPEDVSGLTGALVDSLQQRLPVQLSARMLSAADMTLGTLLDVTA